MLLISGALAMSGCASTILLRTDPTGADIYVDGIYHGPSPVPYTDTEIVGATHQIEARLPGYETLYATFRRNGNANIGAIIGGLCLWIPFLWVLDYPTTAIYRLRPIDGSVGGTYPPPPLPPAGLVPPPAPVPESEFAPPAPTVAPPGG